MSRRRGGLFGYWPGVCLLALGLFLLLTSSFFGVAHAALGTISLTLTTYDHDGIPGAGTVDFGDVYPDTPSTVSPAMVASVASDLEWRMTAVTGTIPEGFLLEQRPQGGSSWTTLSPTTAVIADAEPPGTLSYDLRLTPSWDLMPGTYTLQVTYSVAFTDQTPPADQEVTINGGAALTSSAAVTLGLSAVDDSKVVEGMCFSNDNVTWSAWQAYSTTATWTLSAPDGLKTVWAKYRDRAGNEAPPVSASITLDTVPPVINPVSVSSVSRSSALVSWTTNEPASSQVEYGPTTTYGQWSPATPDATPKTAHAVTLSGLNPGTTYNFRPLSSDQAGNLAVGPAGSFTTLQAPPVLTATMTVQGNKYTIRLDWTALTGVTNYVVERKATTDVTFTIITTTTGLSYSEEQRAPFSLDYRVTAALSDGTSLPSNVVTVAVGADTTPPVVSDLVATPGVFSCAVTWVTDEPATSAVWYGPVDGPLVSTSVYATLVTDHAVTITGLAPVTSYAFYVVSVDSQGNSVAYPAAPYPIFTTLTSGPPDPPGNLQATRQGSGPNVDLTWSPVAGAVAYRVHFRDRASPDQAWSAWTEVLLQGGATTLYPHSQPDKKYYYEYCVTALDGQGLESVHSDGVSVPPA